MAAFAMWPALKAYYGSAPRALWALFRQEIYLWRHSVNGRFCIWFSDRMGWTKLYHFPESPGWREHWRRHGKKCSGSPNCQNDNCIEDSQPRWFRWLAEIGQ